MPTSPPAMTAAPTAPDRGDRASFSARATAWADYQKTTLVPEITSALANVYANAVGAYNDGVTAAAAAVAAAASAATAAANAGAAVWSTGTYVTNDRRVSPANGRVYRCTAGVTGSTDPSADPTHWELVNTGLIAVPVTGTSATAAVGTRCDLSNVAATAITAPAGAAGAEFAVLCANGRSDNTINFGAATVRNGANTLTGTLTLNPPVPLHFVWVPATSEWNVKP